MTEQLEKRYALFAWHGMHDAAGGWHDYQGGYPSADAALVALKAILDDQMLPYECWQVIDLQTSSVVFSDRDSEIRGMLERSMLSEAQHLETIVNLLRGSI